MQQITKWSIGQLHAAMQAGEISVREVCQSFLDRIQSTDEILKCFLRVRADEVLKDADKLDQERMEGSREWKPLTGIPVAIKDVLVTRGTETTCGSKILQGFEPPYDAFVVERLRSAGALLIGKTNCDEFAMGSSTENSAFFTTRNPWDLERVPGGSSGGSAAGVAAGQVPAALGTDTGGSIRQPAAFCGVVGIKPTYGRVSRYGLIAFASSLDQIGPFASSVRDAAVVLQSIAGHDGQDSTSSELPVEDYLSALGREVKGLRVGVPREWQGSGLDSQIRESLGRCMQILEALGCSFEEISLPHNEAAIATYYIIAPAEASSNLARYDGVRYGYRAPDAPDLRALYRRTRSRGFGEEVKRRIMIGTYVLSSGYYDAYYLKAGRVRTLIREDYAKAFEKVDILLGPTTPSLPFKIGEKVSDPLQMYLSDVYTVTANLAGVPALSMPGGFTPEGLPIGIQLVGSHFQEAQLLRVAHALEEELQVKRPPLAV